MQGNMEADNSASARKALAKVQKMLQLVSAKRHALALRDYRETLEECLKTEASSTMKILGYRMAARVPTCTTHEIWQLLLEASVSELASSQNAPVLLYSIPILEQIPLPLVIGFLISSEKEPMNKLRAVLQHEQSDVRCVAIASIAKVTLEVAVSIANDGLFAFPFDSHESRIVCQQDLWTIITDVWKVIFQSLLHGDDLHQQLQHNSDVAGAAFVAMRMLFAKTTAMARFNMLLPQAAHNQPTTAQSAANDLAAYVYKEAFPRIRLLVVNAQRLPIKYQVDAAWWVSMLLHMMMDRTGAKCPGLSVAYLEIDVLKASPHDDDDDDTHASTERVRMDQLASNVLETWLLRLVGRKIPLSQSAALCRALFIVLSHPLQEFTRMKAATSLVQQLIAQCYYHKATEVKLEMSHLTVRAFAWVSSAECVALFSRVVEAIHLMERETERHDLLGLLMEGICRHVVSTRDFLLLESLSALDIFRHPVGTSKLSPRTSGSHVYRALVQALLLPNASAQYAKELQVAQLIVLKAFIQVLLYKTSVSVFSQRQSDQETQDVMCYVALLSEHFQNLVRRPELALKESLQFYQQDLQRAWKQVSSCAVRLQLLWIGIQLHDPHQIVPVSRLVELLSFEISQSFSSGDDERELSPEAMAASSSSSVFDDGKLGGGSVHGEIFDGIHRFHRDEHDIATVVAIVECLRALRGVDPQQGEALKQLQSGVHSYFSANVANSTLQTHILDDNLAVAPNSVKGLYAFEVFHPASVFQPPRLQLDFLSRTDDDVRAPTLITGSADPLAIHVTCSQPVPGHEDVIVLSVSCCNTSNIALSEFEIHIQPRGPVRCIDPSNDLKIRIQQGGAGTSSALPPFGVLKAEKRFLVERFAQVSFYFQVVFLDAGSSEVGDESVPARLAASNAYVANTDVLLRRPFDAFSSAVAFQQLWSTAEDSTIFEIEGTHATDNSLSLGQTLLKDLSQRVAVVADLLVDLPIHTQICLLTKTRWDEFVAISLSLSSAAPGFSQASSRSSAWTGICEIRSTKAVVFEMAKHQVDTLTIFCGSVARVAKKSIDKAAADRTNSRTASVSQRTASRPASRTVSYRAAPPVAIADPFAGGAFPSTDLSSAFGQPAVSTDKWATGGDAFNSSPFAMDQLRPTEPSSAGFSGGFGDFTTASTQGITSATTDSSDPWKF